MKTPLLLLLATATLSTATVQAQSRSVALLAPGLRGTAYQRYAFQMLVKADSAALTLQTVNDRWPSSGDNDSKMKLLATEFAFAHQTASRLVGDFDVVQPPPDFLRLHEQVVDTLKALTESLQALASLFAVNCDYARSVGLGCDLVGLRATAARRIMVEGPAALEHVQHYLDSRGRATQMLAEHRVILPPSAVSR